MKNILKKIFRKKQPTITQINKNIAALKKVTMNVTMGSTCPSCHRDGLFYYYNEETDPDFLKLGKKFAICEECLKTFDEKCLLRISRKLKMSKINVYESR